MNDYAAYDEAGAQGDAAYDEDAPEPLALQLAGVVRRYPQAGGFLNVLRGVDFSLRAGEIVALIGPSGAGKSTLLHVCGLLDRPDQGAVLLNGRDVSRLDDRARTGLRRSEVGFVYQFHHLLPEFSALENVVMPQLIAGRRRRDARAVAERLLTRLGLGDRIKHRPAELSGGEQQRVAICRAVANRPRVLLADEPTGNLDPETSEIVFRELLDMARNEGVAALIATHNIALAERMDRVVEMRMGRVYQL